MQGALIRVRIAEHRTLLWDHPSSLRHHSKWGGPDLLADQIAPPVEYEQITSFVLSTLSRLDVSIDRATIDRCGQNFNVKDFTFRDGHNVL
jgi:hypothetical protein